MILICGIGELLFGAEISAELQELPLELRAIQSSPSVALGPLEMLCRPRKMEGGEKTSAAADNSDIDDDDAEAGAGADDYDGFCSLASLTCRFWRRQAK